MCAETLIHMSRYLGKTSNNNNKRCQLWIYSMPCHVCLYRILIRIFGFMIIILYLFISCLLLVFYPACLLLLSDHTMSLPYLLSIAVYLLAPACLWLRHGFHGYDPDLSIHVCLSMLAIWLSHHHSPGSSDSSGSSCPGFGAWSMWLLPVADQSGAAVAWISSGPSRAPSFQAPLFGSRVFLLWLWACLCTVHTCTSLYSRNCAILVM